MSSNNYNQSYDNPLSTDPDETVYEHDVRVDRANWRPDKAPTIEDRFYRQVVPIQATPSDHLSMVTIGPLLVGAPPTLIAGRQYEGIACKIQIQNLTGVGSDVAIISDVSSTGVATPSGTAGTIVQTLQSGFTLPGGSALTVPPLTLQTKDAVYVVALSNTSGNPVVQCLIETFEMHV